jgi:hypothetical protein
MPGPSRTFDNNAARQRAYRRRKKEETDAVVAEAQDTNTWAHLVQEAVAAAKRSGDPLARQVHRAEAYETLRALGDHFYDRAGLPYPQRPWGSWPATTPEGTIPAAPDSPPGGKHLR